MREIGWWWMRVKHKHIGRIAHALDRANGQVACGLGRAEIEKHTREELVAMAEVDRNAIRCQPCIVVVKGAAA